MKIDLQMHNYVTDQSDHHFKLRNTVTAQKHSRKCPLGAVKLRSGHRNTNMRTNRERESHGPVYWPDTFDLETLNPAWLYQSLSQPPSRRWIHASPIWRRQNGPCQSSPQDHRGQRFWHREVLSTCSVSRYLLEVPAKRYSAPDAMSSPTMSQARLSLHKCVLYKRAKVKNQQLERYDQNNSK